MDDKPRRKVGRGGGSKSFREFGKRISSSFRMKKGEKRHRKSAPGMMGLKVEDANRSRGTSNASETTEDMGKKKTGFFRSLSKRWRRSGRKKSRYSVSAEMNGNKSGDDIKTPDSPGLKEPTSEGVKMNTKKDRKVDETDI